MYKTQMIVPFSLALFRPHLEHCVQVWTPLFKQGHGKGKQGPALSGRNNNGRGRQAI